MRWWTILLSIGFLNLKSLGLTTEIQPAHSLLSTVEQKLEGDITRQTLVNQRLQTLQNHPDAIILDEQLPKDTLQRLLNVLMVQEAEVSHIELAVKEAQMEAELTQTLIQDLQRQHVDMRRHLPVSSEVAEKIRDQRQLLVIKQKRVKILQNTRDTLYKTVSLTREYCKQLQSKSQSTWNNQRQMALNDLVGQLHQTQTLWIKQLELLNHQLNSRDNIASVIDATYITLPLQAIATEEKSNLLHLQLDLQTTMHELNNLQDYLAREPPLMVLNTLQKPLETVLNHLHAIKDLLEKKSIFLQDSLRLFDRNTTILPEKDQTALQTVVDTLTSCLNQYEEQQKKVHKLLKKAQSVQALFTKQLHAYLGSRQGLPGLDALAWLNIVQHLKEIPVLFGHRVIASFNLIFSIAQHVSWMRSSVAGLLILMWIRILILLKRFTKLQRLKFANESTEFDQSTPLFKFSIKLLSRYAYSVVFILGIFSLLVTLKVPLNAFFWLFSLLITNLIFGILMHSCHFWLLSGMIQEITADNKTLYYRSYGMLLVGRIITLFSLVVHQLIMDYEVRNLVARFFMLFLFIISLVLFRIWALIPKLLENYWVGRPRYLKQVVRWISFLLPITLLLNAILGLVGYVQLAWAVVGYQSILLLTACIYPFIKGLLNECFNWLSELSIRHLRNGWLWSEALLKPLYQLLKIFTLVITIVLLSSIAGWREELMALSQYPAVWFNKPLVTISDIPVDTWKVIQVLIMSLFVGWLIQWSREFAYRWIFANLKDVGLRNSLSVFTQYMAIFLSVLATLQLVGITLSVLKYVLSGFAIGLSFGLRDLFNNFVTGVLLLVERPLKIGDWVTVGEHDGQVIHIGARSITVNTEDHQELMVPNADLFYKHFINWTRHDTIVRITLPLLIHRQDDPMRIKEVVLEVISSIQKILHNPAPEVYFKATDQMLLSFKIEYYVDLTQITSRSEVNSQFLFALWERFKRENITPPNVIHELHVTGQLENRSSLDSTTDTHITSLNR